MKISKTILSGIFVLAFSALLFWAGTAYAATGCFNDTNGHWAETYICWMKDNGITSGTGGGNYSPEAFVTRAQMAVFMQRIINVPPETGDILISSGFSKWQKFYSTDPISFANFANGTFLRPSNAGTFTIINQPDIPVVLYGKNLQFAGVEICYQTEGGNYLSEVRVRTYSQSTNLASSTVRHFDSTDRTDTACRYYVLSTPVVMTAETGVEIFLDVVWTIANTDFGFGRTTFVFQPTNTNAVSVNSLGVGSLNSNEVFILKQADANEPDLSPEVRRP